MRGSRRLSTELEEDEELDDGWLESVALFLFFEPAAARAWAFFFFWTYHVWE